MEVLAILLILAKIFFFTLEHFNIFVLIIALVIAVIFILYAGLEVGLSSLFVLLVLYGFYVLNNSPNEYPETPIPPVSNPQPSSENPNIRDMEIYRIPNEPNIEDDINADPTIKNLNNLLKKPENLNQEDREKLEKMRDQRVKQLMDKKGKSIIDEYNRNNPEPIITHQAEQSENLPIHNKEVMTQEKKQAKPNDKFISVIK
jgi:hypothetical protein